MKRGQHDALSCPYCGVITPAGATLCCGLMGAAVEAVLHRMEIRERLDAAERIAERAESLVTLN